MNNGRTLKVFLVDGTPTGLLTAEIMNWTAHVLTGPRSRLSEMIQRPEVMRTGVYFLVGPDNGDGLGTQVYIGETDDAAQRLKEHNRPEGKGGKDFWERVCVVTSKDANLTKGHIKYLESRLIKIARAAGDANCETAPTTCTRTCQRPTSPTWSSSSSRSRPCSRARFRLPSVDAQSAVCGRSRRAPRRPWQSSSPIFVGDVKKHGITARAQEIDGEFVVMKGSNARRNWEGVETSYTKLFKDLVKAGVLSVSADGMHNTFTRDYAFRSPSAAAAVVCGRNTNGRTHWTVQGTNATYGEWQDEQVSKAAAMIDSGAMPYASASLMGAG